MTVQTIPAIKDMTPAERAELMEALWQEMSKTPAEVEPPEWHLQALQEREQAIADGTDEFIPFEEFQALLEEETSQRKAR